MSAVVRIYEFYLRSLFMDVGVYGPFQELHAACLKRYTKWN